MAEPATPIEQANRWVSPSGYPDDCPDDRPGHRVKAVGTLLHERTITGIVSPVAAPPSPALTLDLSQVPFSRRGTFFAVSRLEGTPHGPPGVYLRTVHGDARHQALFRLELLHDGTSADFTEHATPDALRLDAGPHGAVDIVLSGASVLASGVGVALRLHPLLASPYDVVLNVATGQWQYTDFGANWNLMLTASSGLLAAEPGWNGLRAEDASFTVQPTPAPAWRLE